MEKPDLNLELVKNSFERSCTVVAFIMQIGLDFLTLLVP